MLFPIIIVAIYFLIIEIVSVIQFNNAKNRSYKNYSQNLRHKGEDVCFLNFYEFKDYFRVNKKRWGLDKEKGLVYYRTPENAKILIKFSQKDYFKAINWISDLIEVNENYFNEAYTKDLAKFLESVQEDIDQAREESRKQIEEGRKIVLEVKSRIDEELKQVDSGNKIDAILAARVQSENNK